MREARAKRELMSQEEKNSKLSGDREQGHQDSGRIRGWCVEASGPTWSGTECDVDRGCDDGSLSLKGPDT